MKITRRRPEIALPGGMVRLEIEGASGLDGLSVTVGGVKADILGAAPGFVTFRVPQTGSGQTVVSAGKVRATTSLQVGTILADELHPVANPVVDSLGNIYVTFSGTRGESVPFGVFVVSPSGDKQPFLGDITNPTGLAIGPDGLLYISSRHSGTIFRSTFDKQIEKFVDGLGIATGIAFDPAGNLLVGDRSGTIYRVSPTREVAPLCELEPSVSAYHLAVDGKGDLFVTGPTLASQDPVYRVRPDGTIAEAFRGFGRPQGAAFDPGGTLHLVGSFRGRKGVFRLQEGREPELRVTSPMLVGIAFDPSGRILYLVDNALLYRVEL